MIASVLGALGVGAVPVTQTHPEFTVGWNASQNFANVSVATVYGQMQNNASNQALGLQQYQPPSPPPGIYWRRTGGKSHTVTIQR